MKLPLALGLAAAALSAAGTVAARPALTCDAHAILCSPGSIPVCTANVWGCLQLPASSSSSGKAEQCVAKCPDGHEYRTCTEDGHPIHYFADPCLTHSASPSSTSSSSASSVSSKGSSSSANACGPSAILCGPGHKPVCFGRRWSCLPAWLY